MPYPTYEQLVDKLERLEKTAVALGLQVRWAAGRLNMSMYEIAVAAGTIAPATEEGD